MSDDFARPPGYRPDLAGEGPRSERRQTTTSPGATADRHSQDRRSAPRGRFPAPKPQKAPKPLSGREFNDGMKRGGVDLDRPVTPDTLRQAVGERDYQRRRDPDLFAGVAAGFRSLFPGPGSFDATGKRKAATPRGGVTFRSVLGELGLGSLDAAHRAGRRKVAAKAAGTIAGGSGDDTLGGQGGSSKTLPDGVLREIARDEGPPRAVTEEQIDKIEAVYRGYAAKLRVWGLDFAADNLDKYLEGSGGTKTVDRDAAREFEPIAKAERVNQQRFEESFLDAGDDEKSPHEFYEAISTLGDGESKRIGKDFWDVVYGGKRTVDNVMEGDMDFVLGTGRTSIRSEGEFYASRRGIEVSVWGEVDLSWTDPFDFKPGGSGAAGPLALQEYGRAKPFVIESKWKQQVHGIVVLKNGRPVESSFTWIDQPNEAK